MCAEKYINLQVLFVLHLHLEYIKILYTFLFYVSVIGMRQTAGSPDHIVKNHFKSISEKTVALFTEGRL